MCSVYNTAKSLKLATLMEKSQSGNGGHLWLFFNTAVLASTARNLGLILLHEAMKRNKRIHFDSFDRIFPTQDIVSVSHPGNLIALPLQYDFLRNNCSVFINELGQTIKKPFHYLQSVGKVSTQQVDAIIREYQNINDFFETPKRDLLNLSPISSTLEIEELSLIRINKYGLTSSEIMSIRKLACMYNPKYYKLLKLNKSTYGIPRVLEIYQEDERYIYLPRGLKESLISLCSEYTYNDLSSSGNTIDIAFKGSLRDNQIPAYNEIIKHHYGIINAIAGFGKTIVAICIMCHLKVSTLIIVDTQDLVRQWKQKIEEFVELPDQLKKCVGEYSGKKKKLTHIIDIVTPRALMNIEDSSTLQQYGLVIVDECHHVPSTSLSIVMGMLQAKNIFSFTATLKREDGLEKKMYMYLGNVIYKENKQASITSRTFKQLLIPRYTTYHTLIKQNNYATLLNKLSEDTKRNYNIVQDIIEEMHDHRCIIVLTERKAHIDALYKQLSVYEYPVYCIDGDTKTKLRNSMISEMKSLNHYCLLATSQLIGEGFDLPTLDTLFLTLPIKWEGRIEQYVGRIHRQSKDKEIVKVYDYIDVHIPILERMFSSRLKTYKREGYTLLENNQELEIENVILSKDNYLPIVTSYMMHAKESIIFMCDYVSINRIKRNYKLLNDLSFKGIKILLIYKKELDNESKSFLDSLSILYKQSNHVINGIMLDENQFLSSNTSFLGVQSNDLFYMMIDDERIVDEVKQIFE